MKKQKILIDATNIKSGGGLVHLQSLLNSEIFTNSKYIFHVIGSKKIVSALKRNNSLDLITLDKEEDFSRKGIFIFKQPNFPRSNMQVFSTLYKKPKSKYRQRFKSFYGIKKIR